MLVLKDLKGVIDDDVMIKYLKNIKKDKLKGYL